MHKRTNHWLDSRGSLNLEFALLIGLMMVMAVGTLTFLGSAVSEKYSERGTAVSVPPADPFASIDFAGLASTYGGYVVPVLAGLAALFAAVFLLPAVLRVAKASVGGGQSIDGPVSPKSPAQASGREEAAEEESIAPVTLR